MKKTVVIHQPDFLPYLGFFHRLLSADLYIVFDNVQFLRRGWHHRDKIKTINGEKWLTIGIKKAPQNTKIHNIYLANNNWKTKHLEMLKNSYRKAAYYQEIYPYLQELYSKEFEKIIDFNMASIQMLMKIFDIHINIELASKHNFSSTANELLVDILKVVNATEYLSGVGAKDYFKQEPFDNANIKVIWQDFKHPVYPQLHGEFIPYLSSIDMLFNCGIKESRKILRSI